MLTVICNNLFADRDWIDRTISRHDRDGDGGISLAEFIEMNRAAKAATSASSSAASAASAAASAATSTVAAGAAAAAAATAAMMEKAKLAFNAYDRNR